MRATAVTAVRTKYKSAAPKTAKKAHLLSLPLSLSVWVSACLRSEAGASVARQCEGRGGGNVHEHQFLSSTNKYKSALPCYNTLQYRNINLQQKGTLNPQPLPKNRVNFCPTSLFIKTRRKLVCDELEGAVLSTTTDACQITSTIGSTVRATAVAAQRVQRQQEQQRQQTAYRMQLLLRRNA